MKREISLGEKFFPTRYGKAEELLSIVCGQERQKE